MLEAATAGPGAQLADGFSVPDGARLLGAMFPVHEGSTTGWLAYFAVDGNVAAVYDAFAAQAAKVGAKHVARSPDVCVYDVRYTWPRTNPDNPSNSSENEHVFVGLDGSPLRAASKAIPDNATHYTYGLRCAGTGSLGNGRSAAIFVRRGDTRRDQMDFADGSGRQAHGFESIAAILVSTGKRSSKNSPFDGLTASELRRSGAASRRRETVPAPPTPATPLEIPVTGQKIRNGYAEITVEEGSNLVTPPFGTVCAYGFTAIVDLGTDARATLGGYERQMTDFLHTQEEAGDATDVSVNKQKSNGVDVVMLNANGYEARLNAIAVMPQNARGWLLVDACDVDR